MGAPTSWGLPSAGSLGSIGNPSTQLGQAEQLFNTAKAGLSSVPPNPSDLTSLLGAGVTLALGSLGSSPGAQVARSLVSAGSGIISGAAVGGPWGAAVGAIAAVGSALSGEFQGYEGVKLAPSQAAQELFQLREQWVTGAGNVGRETQKPQGWSFYDYLAAKYPVKSTKRVNDLWTLYGQAIVALWATAQTLGVGFHNADTVNQLIDQLTTGLGVASASAYVKTALPLCTPVVFAWGTPSAIENCVRNEWFGWAIPPWAQDSTQKDASPPQISKLYTLWQGDTQSISSNGKTMTEAAIMASAEARRPDPIYFCADLYVLQDGMADGSSTLFFNLELLTMVSTACGMLAVGARTDSILRELLFQQKAIYDQSGSVPYGCRMLVEDYLAMAKAEKVNDKSPVKSSPQKVASSAKPARPAPTSPEQAAALAYMKPGLAPSSSSGTAAIAVGGVGLAALASYKYLLPRFL